MQPFEPLCHFRKGTFHSPVKVTEDLPEIYTHMRHSGHLAIQEDYEHWAGHGLVGKYGKLFLMDPEDSETISLFFDDHIRFEDPSLEINIVAPVDINTGQFIPIGDLIQSGHVNRVDTLRALLDIDYFFNFVARVLSELERG